LFGRTVRQRGAHLDAAADLLFANVEQWAAIAFFFCLQSIKHVYNVAHLPKAIRHASGPSGEIRRRDFAR
jgi:hypothetical protein